MMSDNVCCFCGDPIPMRRQACRDCTQMAVSQQAKEITEHSEGSP